MAPLTRVILYVRDVDRSAAFYARHFGFSVLHAPSDRITELVPADGGMRLLLHKAGKAQKLGQAAVKLVFDIEDIPGFCAAAKSQGLVFGSPHQADGYQFANAKDPDGNSLQVSSRAYREAANG
ncbi:VOC family protein [Labrenzia sp. OB1]|uniref:VOC family protein n=1 Tax=Labrenzia sp. OB1 TaxID=1561204 RepID=UPI0007B27872|nr:VOC family protein [Labrenzia sp. OB1]KZM48848.1 glyoxalase [Labrenzia sp. OB1]